MLHFGVECRLFDLTKQFDGVHLDSLEVSRQEFDEAKLAVSDPLKKAIATAQENITTFHTSQIITEPSVETTPGIACFRKSVPIQNVGLYIPGGLAPLFSTVLMLGVPATLAGCQDIIICTPPNADGKIHPAILYTADLLGITKVFKLGGSQAIAAMTLGTQSIPRTYKLFGPGNQYVVMAKHLAQKYGVAIDMPAGPSEVCVIADEAANPRFVASDLLAQAEHGPDSQVVLISDSQKIIQRVQQEIETQTQQLSRSDLIRQSLDNSKLILVEDIPRAFEMSNAYAPEHLIINTQNAEQDANLVVNAGSVFVGQFTPESLGDYASGTNHSLPTNAFARNYSGVSVDSFVKKITFQKSSKQGLMNIASTVQTMAEAEGLDAHAATVTVRLTEKN